MKPPNLSVGGKPLLRKVFRYPVAEPRRGACSYRNGNRRSELTHVTSRISRSYALPLQPRGCSRCGRLKASSWLSACSILRYISCYACTLATNTHQLRHSTDSTRYVNERVNGSNSTYEVWLSQTHRSIQGYSTFLYFLSCLCRIFT